MIPNYQTLTVREAAILTNSYVAGAIIDGNNFNNQVVLHVWFTKGSLTSAEILIETSNDGVSYTQETNLLVSGGTTTWTPNAHTFTIDAPTTGYTYNLPIKSKYVRISAKGTGTVTSSSMKIVAEYGNV